MGKLVESIVFGVLGILVTVVALVINAGWPIVLLGGLIVFAAIVWILLEIFKEKA